MQWKNILRQLNSVSPSDPWSKCCHGLHQCTVCLAASETAISWATRAALPEVDSTASFLRPKNTHGKNQNILDSDTKISGNGKEMERLFTVHFRVVWCRCCWPRRAGRRRRERRRCPRSSASPWCCVGRWTFLDFSGSQGMWTKKNRRSFYGEERRKTECGMMMRILSIIWWTGFFFCKVWRARQYFLYKSSLSEHR